ncbi:acid phosphatase [Serratia bockelmannii]|uniref:acid phosphatase n=1 Tax=Serratia bockelmannii TaxID=2703793 RepID=UPI00235EDC8B|nr:phosphatase PAP2 family protein [Serratia bockelmannii]
MKLKPIFIGLVTAGIMFSTYANAFKVTGFLTQQETPDSLEILPPPPSENTVTFQSDKAQYEMGRILHDDNRKLLASKDADYKNFNLAFSEAFGMEISESRTPVLYNLIMRVLQDSHDYAMRKAKNHYKRVRPYVIFKDSTCTPEKDEEMATTGSYPSGHASFGWATALILAEINPQRKTEILRRGYDFGESRVICGAHWQSDVESGRLMGAAVVAALHANANFMNSLVAAKKEFVTLQPQVNK